MGFPSPAYFAQQFGEEILSMTTGSNPVLTTNGCHNMLDGTQVLIQFCRGITNLNGQVFPIKSLGPAVFTINAVAIGVYTGGGTYSIIGTANHYNPALTG